MLVFLSVMHIAQIYFLLCYASGASFAQCYLPSFRQRHPVVQ
jgi:hypothetical protein